jgi:hypothetical protein
VRVVALVNQGIDECDALPGVVLHIEHQRLDFALGCLDGDTRTAGAIKFGLDLLKIDHGGLRGINEAKLTEFRAFCKCSFRNLQPPYQHY